MMTRLKNTVTSNSNELTPVLKATQVLRAATDAAWELGIPPISTKRLKLIFFSRARFVNTLVSCTKAPQASAWKSGLEVACNGMDRSPG
jgi:hypothetical protein